MTEILTVQISLPCAERDPCVVTASSTSERPEPAHVGTGSRQSLYMRSVAACHDFFEP